MYMAMWIKLPPFWPRVAVVFGSYGAMGLVPQKVVSQLELRIEFSNQIAIENGHRNSGFTHSKW